MAWSCEDIAGLQQQWFKVGLGDVQESAFVVFVSFWVGFGSVNNSFGFWGGECSHPILVVGNLPVIGVGSIRWQEVPLASCPRHSPGLFPGLQGYSISSLRLFVFDGWY